LGLPHTTSTETKAREALGFDAIYAEHFAFVWRCLLGLGVPREQLDDSVQDVFLVVHRQLSTFREESTVTTWLYGIARRVASNQRRSLARKGGLELLDERTASLAGGPHERAQEAEAAHFVERFVGTLDDKRRDIFVLAVLEELSIPEVARMLSIPLNTAYSRLRAVRAEFRQALARGSR
jgi:RNA polymerase sigma-70 factor (ECF subfamily)